MALVSNSNSEASNFIESNAGPGYESIEANNHDFFDLILAKIAEAPARVFSNKEDASSSGHRD